MSLRKRLERLEVRGPRHAEGASDYLEAYFRALENLERKEAGLPPLPYTDEDRLYDEGFLRETLPAYRALPGWQTEEARHVLDEWDKNTLERLEKGTSR